MKNSKKERMYAQIEAHGNNLNSIFNTGLEPVKLCKKLHTLEMQAHHLTTIECNTGADMQVKLGAILTKVKKVLFPSEITDSDLWLSIYVNGDARGYALKISDKVMRERGLKLYSDMGGYGILAPEFDGN